MIGFRIFLTLTSIVFNFIKFSCCVGVSEPVTLPTSLFKPIAAPTEQPLYVAPMPNPNASGMSSNQPSGYAVGESSASMMSYNPGFQPSGRGNLNMMSPTNYRPTNNVYQPNTWSTYGSRTPIMTENRPTISQRLIGTPVMSSRSSWSSYDDNNMDNSKVISWNTPTTGWRTKTFTIEPTDEMNTVQQYYGNSPIHLKTSTGDGSSSSYKYSSSNSYRMSSDMMEPEVHRYEYEERNGVPTKNIFSKKK